ncbi:hypothetical protein [Nonomuraea sp. NPDC003201]
MNGTVLNRADRSGVVEAVVSVWKVGERPGRGEPLAVTRSGDGGRFELDLPVDRGDVVLRTYRGKGAEDLDQRALASVVQLAVPSEPIRRSRTVVWLDPPNGDTRPAFGRALIDGHPAEAGLTLTASDRQRTTTARGGWFTLTVAANAATELRLWLDNGGHRVGGWQITADDPESDATFAEAATCQVTGRVSRQADGSGLPRLRVELLDRSGRWANPVGSATTGDTGDFTLAFPHLVDLLPEPTFAVWSRDERIAAVDWKAAWVGRLLRGVDLVLDVPPDRPLTYRLDVQVFDRSSRAPVPGLRAEVWNAAFDTMLKQATTDGDGRLSVAVPPASSGGPPELGLRLYHDRVRVAEQRIPQSAWRADLASVFCEVDLPASAPLLYRVLGRLVDQVTWSGVAGLRVEAWDQVPRHGGLLGAAAYTALDGAFDLALPAVIRPELFFRVYAADALIATITEKVSWDEAGTGSVLLQIAGVPSADGEVVLHELGETIATAVNRMQGELARYPSTMGAYVVDELDLSVPVAVQLDRLGQVRAKVVDRAPADEQLGRIRMRVRPVLGAHLPPADQLDQPLTTLTELSADAITRLNALRVYSVEDLARLAATPAGAAALSALDLRVDLAALLDKVALLALSVLLRPVREALVALGVTSVRAFAYHPETAALAAALSLRLGQEITAEAVCSWQRLAREHLTIPLPTTERTDDEQR